MAHYVVLAKFTDQGMRAIKDTTKRAQAFRQLAQEMGVRINDIYWTFGSYDVILTMDAQKEEAVAALMLKVGSLGNLTSQTLRAFSEPEVEALLAKF